jgi:hypothetical protein
VSKKITVVVQSNHSLQDDDGKSMHQWEIHTVAYTPIIEKYISDGLLKELDTKDHTKDEAEEAPTKEEAKEEAKKATVSTKSTKQETAQIQQENVNG